jgi:hypothetical protein
LLKLTKDFKTVARKMYSVLFEDEKARVTKATNILLKKPTKKKFKVKSISDSNDVD